MSIPSEQELQRLFDDQVATNIRAAEASVSWPALRILGYLAEIEGATTGEIARDLNMDMTEVRDYLDELEDLSVVTKTDTNWQLAVHEIQLTVDLREELSLTYTLNRDQAETAKSDRKTSSWWQRWIPWYAQSDES